MLNSSLFPPLLPVTPFERTATHTVTTHTVTPPTLTPHSQHPSSSVEGEGGDGGGRGEGGGEKGEVAVRSPSSWTGGSAHNKIKHHESESTVRVCIASYDVIISDTTLCSNRQFKISPSSGNI